MLRAFDAHFFSKCYLTEQWHGSSYEMDVDHFVPVNQNPALKFEWENLFPAAHVAIMRFQHAQASDSPQLLATARRELRVLLSRQAPFTMLMRAMTPVVEYVPPELLD